MEMALTQEDLAALGEFIDKKIEGAVADVRKDVSGMVTEATTPQPQTNDEPQNQPENQPDYYVHLANGKVIESKDAGSTHMTDPETGEAVVVIGRYPKGA
jgi:hypothetical protein